MPRQLVTNTTPLITLSIACGSLDILRQLYDTVLVPQEVALEITAGGMQRPGVAEFLASQDWLKPMDRPCAIAPICSTPWIGARHRSSKRHWINTLRW